jgi:hypothetical protein
MFSHGASGSVMPPGSRRRGGPVKLETFLPELMAKLVAGTVDSDPPPAPVARLGPTLPRAA